MPIKPENKSRYPSNWKQISEAVRKDAGHRCQWEGCKARQYSVGVWQKNDAGLFVWAPIWGQDDNPRTYAQARQVAADEQFSRYGDEDDEPKYIVIVLTVAHLDHDPANCDPSNLRAWCQRHHLAYEHEHHQRNAQATRRAKSGTLELFA